jgi:hypothetical protein
MRSKAATALRAQGTLSLIALSATVVLWALPIQALGSFGAATNFAVGTGPNSVAIGNLNGDANPDVVVANFGSNDASVLLGNGAGSFGPATNFVTGEQPAAVAIGRLNGDAKPDLAVANYDSLGSGDVSILLNNGGGSFGAATHFAVGLNPQSVAIGDLNGDANPDLALTRSGQSANVSILLGNGTGSFGAATHFTAGFSPTMVRIGDLNGDANPDLAVTNQGSDTVSILFGNGAGSFGPASSYFVGHEPISLTIGDLNGDANPDLAVTNFGYIQGRGPPGDVWILLNNGAGSFGPATSFAVGTRPFSVAIGNLNGDANPDLALTTASSGDVSILLGTGAGTFGAATHFTAGTGPNSLAIGNLNGDGKPDLAVSNGASQDVSILLGKLGPLFAFVSPTANATGVPRTAPIVAAFDQAMNKPSVEAAFSLKRGNGATVGGSFGWYGNALIFIPAAPLAKSATYIATVGPGARDLAGNHLGATNSWQFTTAPQPMITAVVPADGATEVLPNAPIVAAFDTVMDKPSAEAAFSLKRTSDGAPVAGSFGWYGNALIFKPNADLAGGTQYTASVSTAATDLVTEHRLAAAKTWRFTTTIPP